MARGAALGAEQPVILHLLDIEPAKESLAGVRMELIDSAYPLLQGVQQASTSPCRRSASLDKLQGMCAQAS